MNRKSRIPKTLDSIATSALSATSVLTLLMACSVFWGAPSLELVEKHVNRSVTLYRARLSFPNRGYSLGRANMSIGYYSEKEITDAEMQRLKTLSPTFYSDHKNFIAEFPRGRYWQPMIHRHDQGIETKEENKIKIWREYNLSVPSLLLPIFTGIYPSVKLKNKLRRKRRIKGGLCGECGYNLKGSTNSRCSECGEKTSKN
jgi:hypothetical protein